jgi:hypothetical protein
VTRRPGIVDAGQGFHAGKDLLHLRCRGKRFVDVLRRLAAGIGAGP